MNKLVTILCLILSSCTAQYSEPKAANSTTKTAREPAAKPGFSTAGILAASGLLALGFGSASVADGENDSRYVFPLIMGGTGVVLLTSALICYLTEEMDE